MRVALLVTKLSKAVRERRLLKVAQTRVMILTRILIEGLHVASLRESVECQYDHHRRMNLMFESLKRSGKLSEFERQDYASRWLMVELLGLVEGTVLDIGCGGCEAFPLMQKKGLTPVGIDVYAPILRNVKRNFVIRAVMEFLPFKRGSFEAVYARHALEHTINPKRTLGEINRVLKDDGRLVFVTPHYFPDPEPAHVTRLKQDRWETLLRKTGFRVLFSKLLMRNSLELTMLAQKSIN